MSNHDMIEAEIWLRRDRETELRIGTTSDRGLSALRRVFAALASEQMPACRLDVKSVSRMRDCAGVVLYVADVFEKIDIDHTPDGVTVSWYQSSEGWLEKCEQIDRLLESQHGHQYLGGPDPLIIVLSHCE